MRTNSGMGKSKNNLRDPTMKEHELAHHKVGSAPPEKGRKRREMAEQRDELAEKIP